MTSATCERIAWRWEQRVPEGAGSVPDVVRQEPIGHDDELSEEPEALL